MSYSSTGLTSRSRKPLAGEAQDKPGEAHLSANAQAWRRWALVGYRRNPESVHTGRAEAADTERQDDESGRSDDGHHSGFQGL
jgi:hypothetical protein